MTNAQAEGIARGVLESVDDDCIVIALPHSDYKLHLVPTVAASEVTTPPGKRIRGRIDARALRIHASADGGGKFIEPVWGAPRIVAGEVMAIDDEGRVLVDLGAPVWVTPPAEQDRSILAVGSLVNCYVESGTSFTPA